MFDKILTSTTIFRYDGEFQFVGYLILQVLVQPKYFLLFQLRYCNNHFYSNLHTELHSQLMLLVLSFDAADIDINYYEIIRPSPPLISLDEMLLKGMEDDRN